MPAPHDRRRNRKYFVIGGAALGAAVVSLLLLRAGRSRPDALRPLEGSHAEVAEALALEDAPPARRAAAVRLGFGRILALLLFVHLIPE